jgi:uncharacterized protein (TIGR03435 family)
MIRATALIVLLACVAVAQPAPPPQAFEVASIRPNPGPWHVLVGYSSSGTRLTLEGYYVTSLIMEAYNLKGYEVSYTPPAMEVYDIAAKAEGDGNPTRAEFRPMLQTLLADRFKLKFHREMRELSVYALVVGKNGPRFKESAPDAPALGNHTVKGRNQTAILSQATMESVAREIGNNGVDRPVLDKTGLTGKYDVKLEATPEFRINNNPQPEDISVFDAVQNQLGLRLEPQKAMIEVLVVDHIEKPSAN